MLTAGSHLTLLLSVARYILSYITFNSYSSSAQVSYRLAFLSAAATYGIVVYKGHIARGRLQGTPAGIALKLITDENVQYLGEFIANFLEMDLFLLPFLAYMLNRYGFGVALLAPGSFGPPSIQRLLHLPRCDLLSLLPDPYSATPQAGWPAFAVFSQLQTRGQTASSGRDHWQVH